MFSLWLCTVVVSSRSRFDRPRLDVEEDPPPAAGQRPEDERHIVALAADVGIAVARIRRDGHRVAFGQFGLGIAEHGVPVHRVVTEVDFHAFAMEVIRHVGAIAVEPGEVPRVMIAVDQGHDRDAEAGHDETPLLGCPGVAGQVDAVAGGDRFHLPHEQVDDAIQERGIATIGRRIEARRPSWPHGYNSGGRSRSGAGVVPHRVHRPVREVGQQFRGPGEVRHRQPV